VRRLIINADDFGLTAGVNRGIAECCRQGVVTSTTLMANGGAFADALAALRQLPPAAAIGCHVGLVDGRPLLPPAQISSLVAHGTGAFAPSIASFAWAASRERIRADHVEAEATAQMRQLQSAGVRLSHFDAHKHAHMFPAILAPLLRAARNCGISAVRNPFEPRWPLPPGRLLRRPDLWKRCAEVKLLRAWSGHFVRAVREAGLATTDGTLGIAVTGMLDSTLFAAILAALPDGTWELCCHPGYHDADLDAAATRLRQSRERERELLTSPFARDLLARHQVQLISYWDLHPQSPAGADFPSAGRSESAATLRQSIH
jgi:predicted glycoside hydrolase/deacetylase ChbG (UPF0249 family)